MARKYRFANDRQMAARLSRLLFLVPYKYWGERSADARFGVAGRPLPDIEGLARAVVPPAEADRLFAAALDRLTAEGPCPPLRFAFTDRRYLAAIYRAQAWALVWYREPVERLTLADSPLVDGLPLYFAGRLLWGDTPYLQCRPGDRERWHRLRDPQAEIRHLLGCSIPLPREAIPAVLETEGQVESVSHRRRGQGWVRCGVNGHMLRVWMELPSSARAGDIITGHLTLTPGEEDGTAYGEGAWGAL